MNKYKVFFGILVFFLCLGIGLLRQNYRIDSAHIKILHESQTQEAATISASNIARKKGGRYAFDVLRASIVPPFINRHKLGHAVGAILYQQEGLRGITACVGEYRNSCSHAILSSAMGKEGERVIPDLVEICDATKEGLAGITRCYHGVGHGVMVYTGYDFPKTIQLCIGVGTKERNFVESADCIGGAFMEFVDTEIHDDTSRALAIQKYMATTDPLFPCRETYMPEYLHAHCFHFVPQLLATRASLERKSIPMSYCALGSNEREQKLCYGAFGTQFMLNGITEDIKEVRGVDRARFATVIRQCAGYEACIDGAIETLLWGGGKNKPLVIPAIALCQQIEDVSLQDHCYSSIIDVYNNRQFVDSFGEFCDRMPTRFQSECVKKSQRN